MNLLDDALRAGHAAVRPSANARRVLVAGGAGALGSAVLEQLLASRAFAQVGVLATQPLNAGLRGFVAVPVQDLALPRPVQAEDTALIVFDRARHANGREQAFLRPEPSQLADLARALRTRGVRRLIVVVPHATGRLPDALKHGLANLDEHAVAALGFDHLVLMRSAQAAVQRRDAGVLQRLADWVLAQLLFMIPQRDKPVRSRKVAQFAAQIAAQLPDSPPGTRVVAPEVLWAAAQSGDIAAHAGDWLHARERPEPPVPRMRM